LLCFFFLPFKSFTDYIEGSDFEIILDKKMKFNLDGEKGMEANTLKITVIKEAINIYVGIKANNKF
jgi:diacylglycerol kinase family enzyme